MCIPDVRIRTKEEDTALATSEILATCLLQGGEHRCNMSR